jgi:hypothetical protein
MPVSRLLPWAAGALAGLLVLIALPARGPALNPDAMSYLGAATSLAHHGTLRVPWAQWDDPDSTSALTDYPQGFSLLLAGPIALGASPAAAARLVEGVSAGVVVGVAVGLAETLAGSLAGVLTAFLLIAMPAMTEIHLWVLSEPVFLALVALTLAALVQRPERPGLHGVLAALANLVRFAGSFLVAAVVCWALISPGTWRLRARRGVVAALPAVLLHAWWHLQGLSPGGGVDLATYPGFGATLVEGWGTVRGWLVPGLAPSWWATGIALLVVAGAGGMIWRAIRDDVPGRRFWGALGLLASIYVGMVVFARLHVVYDLPFDNRILSPPLLLAALGIAVAISRCSPQPRAVALTAVSLWVCAALAHDVAVVREARAGLGYESAEWQASTVAGWLRGEGAGGELYGNDPAGVYFLVGRPSHLLPTTLDADTVRALAARFRSHRAALLQFESSFVVSASPDSLALRLGLHLAARFAHGAVWAAP